MSGMRLDPEEDREPTKAPKIEPQKRPSGEFDQSIADEICQRLSRGESLRHICGAERDDFIPGQTTVYRWLDEEADFAKQYARARANQADHYVDEIVEIADSPNAGIDAEGNPVLRDPQRDRLRVDARKWVAGKLAPKKYGDAVNLKHSDPDGGPVQFAHADELASLPADQRARVRSAIMAVLEGKSG